MSRRLALLTPLAVLLALGAGSAGFATAGATKEAAPASKAGASAGAGQHCTSTAPNADAKNPAPCDPASAEKPGAMCRCEPDADDPASILAGTSAASPAPIAPQPAPVRTAAAMRPAAPDTPRGRASALAAQAAEAADSGHFDEAMGLYRRALALDPAHGDARCALGWLFYRRGDFSGAAETFTEVVRREPGRVEAWSGLGYAKMQAGAMSEADGAFARGRALAPGDLDLIKGTALLALRTGRPGEAAAMLRPVVAAAPQDEDAANALRRALAESGQLTDRRLRPTKLDGRTLDDGSPGSHGSLSGAPGFLGSRSRPEPLLDLSVRAGVRYFERYGRDGWTPLFVRGVNLGVALPGKFPSEFPEDEATYADWLSRIHAMNANVVRLYTLLPPAFYAALDKENRAHPDDPLYLVQGVWVELPPDDDFSDAGWNADYTAEIHRVIDVLHGNMDAAPRAGHASGIYQTDVSPWVLGFILGREWEPFSVKTYDARAAGLGTRCTVAGRFVEVRSGTPMECWVAGTVETTAAYLADAYGESSPLAFTNWPTLDPLHHPTEATREEEDTILRARGATEFPKRGPVYDNDAVQVDANAIVATPRWTGGLFASYHVYPYYPDFMDLDPGYVRATDAQGPNAFAGYLAELARYHAGRPVLIAETGVPSSRGVAHRQPQGFNHGGHDETAQADIDARLVRAIQETGCAGAIVFAWIDEWFKRNWLFTDVEIPSERNPLWFNVLDPEQNFGIMAAVPGRVGEGIVLDGRSSDWDGIAPYYASGKGKPLALYAFADAAYLYLRLDTATQAVSPRASVAAAGLRPGGAAAGLRPGTSPAGSNTDPFGGWSYWIGIDTYDRARGATRLPDLDGKLRTAGGLEFALRFDGKDPRILVSAPYDVGSHGLTGPFASMLGEEGRFVPMVAEIRLKRIGRDGTVFPAESHDMSPLVRGTTDPDSPAYDSLSDFAFDPETGVLEARIPWGLLNVTDPSARRVLHQTTAHGPPFDTLVTDGFTFTVAAVPPGRSKPSAERPVPSDKVAPFAWPTWEQPVYHLRPKALYGALAQTFAAIPDPPPPPAPVP